MSGSPLIADSPHRCHPLLIFPLCLDCNLVSLVGVYLRNNRRRQSSSVHIFIERKQEPLYKAIYANRRPQRKVILISVTYVRRLELKTAGKVKVFHFTKPDTTRSVQLKALANGLRLILRGQTSNFTEARV